MIAEKIKQIKQLLAEIEHELGRALTIEDLDIEEILINHKVTEPVKIDTRDLENGFPHVMKMIETLWGYEELYWYFDQLLVNHRSQPRQGFPINVVNDILFLQDLHTYRVRPPKQKDIWAGTNYK